MTVSRVLNRSPDVADGTRSAVEKVIAESGFVSSAAKHALRGFADGSYFKMHPGAPAEPVLVAWGITSSAKPVFLGLEPGANESTDAWAGFFSGLKARGLRDPLLVISDGGKGLIAALETVFCRSARQKCLIHRGRNILAKVPVHAQAQVKAEFWRIFDDIDAAPGSAAQAVARNRAGPSPRSGASSTRRPSSAWRTTSSTSLPTFASRPSIGTTSVIPISSNAPSGKLAGE